MHHLKIIPLPLAHVPAILLISPTPITPSPGSNIATATQFFALPITTFISTYSTSSMPSYALGTIVISFAEIEIQLPILAKPSSVTSASLITQHSSYAN